MNSRKYSFISTLICVALVMCVINQAHAGSREIGGYVAQAEDRFVRNVWNFIKNFKTTKTIGGHQWKYDQYYYMEPFVFEGSHNAYVDCQDMAFVSCHGNFWVMACHDKIADVDFRDCPAYGDLPNMGDLEFLIVESCLTIIAFPDPGFAWNGWRHTATGGIFGGLHQAMGFHTNSQSDNGIPQYFANYCRGNSIVWCAWFCAVQEERGWLGSLLGMQYPGYASAIMPQKCKYDRMGSYVSDPTASDLLFSVWEE
ncbi:MAG: DUF6345 domain-containing protein [Phycisphaerae bacterium]|nr:DUF6345 domain-containing protein [Phycisphaerae bacterium]